MRDLSYQLKQLCRHNRDGSRQTQRDRERMLVLIAERLDALGYRKMGPQSLKPKHVEALVKGWKAEQLSSGTIKNRLTVLRWWAKKVNRRHVVAGSNEHYGICVLVRGGKRSTKMGEATALQRASKGRGREQVFLVNVPGRSEADHGVTAHRES